MTALSLRLLCALLLCVAPPAATRTTVQGAAEGTCDTRQGEECLVRRPRGGHEERLASLADLYVDSSGEEGDTATSTIAITAASASASASASTSSSSSSSSVSSSSSASTASAQRLLTAHGVAVFPRAINVLLTRRCRAESEHRFEGLARGVQARGTNPTDPYSPSTSTAARFCFKEICSHDPRRYNLRVAPRESPCVARAIAGRPPWRRAVAALLGEDARLLYSG